MKILPLMLCIFSVLGLKAQMPGHAEMLDHFFRHYKFEQGFETRLKLQKKKQGWFMAEEEVRNPYVYKNVQLYWSATDKKFHPLSYPPAETGDIAAQKDLYYRQQGNDQFHADYLYDRNIYFGYTGWDVDVMKELGELEKLSDLQLESLGRACSNFAIGYFYDQWGDWTMNDDPDRKPLSYTEPVTAARAEKFTSYTRLSLRAYTRLLKQNSRYETMVGNIRLKLAGEYMFAYSTLLYNGFPDLAGKFLEKGIYPDSILTNVRKMLNAVPANGILITIGDLDTYPAWYIQETENYRKDVTVLNYNLLGLRRQLQYLDKTLHGELFSTKGETYLSPDFDYAVQNRESETPVSSSVADFIRKLNSLPPGTRTYTADQLYFGSPEGTKMQLGQYILMPDLMLLDIALTNQGKRPVYFAYKPDGCIIMPYCQPENTLYKIAIH